MAAFTDQAAAIKASINARPTSELADTSPDQITFLRDVLPPSGPIYIMAHVAGGKGWRQIAVRSVDQLAERIRSNDLRGDEVYFAPASYRESSDLATPGARKRRTRDNVAAVRSCWLDIDVGREKAQSGLGYASIDDARNALADFCRRLGLSPTYVVGSGTGLHCYWIFESEIGLIQWEKVARLLKRACERTSFLCDPARTADAASVMRPVGVHHRKDPTSPRLVAVLARGATVDFSDFSARLSALAGSQFGPRPNSSRESTLQGRTVPPWFHAMPEKNQLDVLDQACRAIPDAEWSSYETWTQVIAALRGLRELPESVLVDILAKHSARSEKWAHDGWTLERLREKFYSFDGGSIGRLFELAERHGWMPQHGLNAGSFPLTGRAEAEQYLTSLYIYVATQHVYLNSATKQIISPAALDESLFHLTRDLSVTPRQLLKSSSQTRRADGMGYHPGAGALYSENGCTLANLYVPWVHDELSPTADELAVWDWLINDQLFAGASDKVARDYILDCIAYPLQFPGRRVASIPLVIGEAGGTGKSTLTEVIPRLLFGPRNVSTATQTEIESNFNDWQAGYQILCLPEIWIGGHRDAEKLANKLKDSVTNPILRVHPKGLKGYSQPNRTTILATSNYENAVVLREGDRRWGVHVTTAAPMPAARARALNAFLEGPRAPGVLRRIFLRRDLSQFDPHGAPPLTDGKRLVIAASRSDAQTAIIDAWKSGDFPFDRDLVVLEDIRTLLADQGVDSSLRKISDILRAPPIHAERINARPRLLAQRTIPDDPVGRRYEGKTTVWALRAASAWSSASERAISAHFEKGSATVATIPVTQSCAGPGTIGRAKLAKQGGP